MSAPAQAVPLTGARSVITQLWRAALWLMVAGVVVQVFLAGLFNFGEADARSTHESVGWTVHTIGMIALVLAIVGPRTREAMLGTLGLVVLNTVQVLLATVEDAPALSAFHPTLALAVLGTALWLVVPRRR